MPRCAGQIRPNLEDLAIDGPGPALGGHKDIGDHGLEDGFPGFLQGRPLKDPEIVVRTAVDAGFDLQHVVNAGTAAVVNLDFSHHVGRPGLMDGREQSVLLEIAPACLFEQLHTAGMVDMTEVIDVIVPDGDVSDRFQGSPPWPYGSRPAWRSQETGTCP